MSHGHAGRILALDVGERRIGVALSDLSRTLATPYITIHATPVHIFFKNTFQFKGVVLYLFFIQIHLCKAL